MGRDTAGVRGMNVSRGDNCVLAMDIARDDTELLVVTENGYGKRTPIAEYPVKGRGAMGVKTIQLTEKKGGVAGALIVREHQDLVFISQNGMVQRTGVEGHLPAGPPAQGVRVMNLREDDLVSAVALVMEDEADTSAVVAGATPARLEPIDEAGHGRRAPSTPPTDGADAPTEPEQAVRRGSTAGSAYIGLPGKGGGPNLSDRHAGPWRCPAARPSWTPSSGVQPRHRRAWRPGVVPPARACSPCDRARLVQTRRGEGRPRPGAPRCVACGSAYG